MASTVTPRPAGQPPLTVTRGMVLAGVQLALQDAAALSLHVPVAVQAALVANAGVIAAVLTVTAAVLHARHIDLAEVLTGPPGPRGPAGVVPPEAIAELQATLEAQWDQVAQEWARLARNQANQPSALPQGPVITAVPPAAPSTTTSSTPPPAPPSATS